MPKNRGGEAGGGGGGGDWSETGTFVRKPTTGWLHKDAELADGSYIRYKLTYFGCVKITESMRSLQYQVRTLATREAIILLAEHNDKIQSKKRKIPRQISRLIGEICSIGCKEVNLCIDVEELVIKSATTGMEINTHSLTAISFASGGEDATKDFFGYVAKDPTNGRACHVFHCPDSTAQLVLASVGQAFELRYKRYLGANSKGGATPVTTTPTSYEHLSRHSSKPSLPPLPPLPTSQRPTGRSNSQDNTSDYTEPYSPPAQQTLPKYMNHGPRKRQLPSNPPPVTLTKQSPPQKGRAHSSSNPPLPSIPPLPLSTSQPVHNQSILGVYSDLPGFPDPVEYDLGGEPNEDDDEDLQMNTKLTLREQTRASYNPYDTMPIDGTLSFTTPPPALPSSLSPSLPPPLPPGQPYDEPTYDVAEGIEDAHGHVTQPPPPSRDHAPNHTPTTSKKVPQTTRESLFDDYAVLEENSAEVAPSPAPPPQEGEYQLITIRQQPSVDREGLEITIKPEQPIYSNNDIMGDGPIYGNTGIEDCPDYDDPSNLSPPPIKPTAAGDYDDPDLILDSAGMDDVDGGGPPPPAYRDIIQEPLPPPVPPSFPPSSPSRPFDDNIYATPLDNDTPPPLPEVDPFAPLSLQLYFHGCISRGDAELCLREDGEFLVRESTKKPGQFVLTGKANGKPQHLLLIDKNGRVKSKDKEFESVPHLVKFFHDRLSPLTIGNCEVYLKRPVEHK